MRSFVLCLRCAAAASNHLHCLNQTVSGLSRTLINDVLLCLCLRGGSVDLHGLCQVLNQRKPTGLTSVLAVLRLDDVESVGHAYPDEVGEELMELVDLITSKDLFEGLELLEIGGISPNDYDWEHPNAWEAERYGNPISEFVQEALTEMWEAGYHLSSDAVLRFVGADGEDVEVRPSGEEDGSDEAE